MSQKLLGLHNVFAVMVAAVGTTVWKPVGGQGNTGGGQRCAWRSLRGGETEEYPELANTSSKRA